MKILVVNDDSISAPGIEVLARAAMELGDVYVVAPAQQCSALSQKLTLRDPLTVEKVEAFPVPVKAAYKVDGTPVDCVKVALYHILKEKPDYVFSGINNGYNVGFDIAYSGTLGAAFEAARNGIPAIAFSITGNDHLPFAEPHLVSIIKELTEKGLEPWEVWNVNFPAMKAAAPKGILWDRPVAPVSLYQEKYIETVLPDGRTILDIKGAPTSNDMIAPGTDAAAVRSGYIAISKLNCTL